MFQYSFEVVASSLKPLAQYSRPTETLLLADEIGWAGGILGLATRYQHKLDSSRYGQVRGSYDDSHHSGERVSSTLTPDSSSPHPHFRHSKCNPLHPVPPAPTDPPLCPVLPNLDSAINHTHHY
jgi:hypothetical protein